MSFEKMYDLSVVNGLRKAQELVEKGWCQFVPYASTADGAKQYCMIGALDYVGYARYGTFKDGLYFKMKQFIERVLPDNLEITDWNDAPERKKEEVVAVFSRATELALKDAMV